MRPLRTLFALAAAAGVFVALSTAPTAGAGMIAWAGASAGIRAATTETADPALLVEVLPGSAGRVSAGTDLTVTVRISNSTDSFLPAGVASLRIDPAPVAGREVLSEWLTPAAEDSTDDDAAQSTDDPLTGDPVADIPTPTLLAGDSRTLTGLIVPAGTSPFGPGSALAVHRLSVTIEAGDQAVTERSAIAVDPGIPVPVTSLAVAMPITIPPSSAGVIPADVLEEYTATDGLLDLQLRQASVTQVAVGIDPRILASIALLGDSAPESVLAWRERLRALPNETFPLSYADTDIAATSQAVGALLPPTGFVPDPGLFPAEPDDAAGDTGEASPSASPDPTLPTLPTQEELLDWDYTSTGIAWPRDDSAVTADLDVFAASGLSTTILSSTNAVSGGPPNASATSGGHPIITSDAALSDLLRSAIAAPTTFERDAAIAELTASLAAISVEFGTANPVVLATLDRVAPTDSFPLATTLAAVSAAPWVTPATLADARARPPDVVTVADRPVDASRISLLTTMINGEPGLGAFASVLADPTPITGERRLSLLALASQSWAVQGEGWEGAVEEYLQRSNQILTSVAVGSRTLTQASDNGDLPIVVTNALDFPVTVTVNVQALRPIPILAIRDSAVEVAIPANSQQRAPIPTESIANGEVTLAVSLTSPTGVPIGQPSTIDVSVRAGWETAATTVLAILVIAVFILGIIRTIRRRRRISKGELPDDRDGDARDLHDEGQAAAGTGKRDD